MQFPELPVEWTPQIIRMLSHREFIILCDQYSLHNVASRLGWDDFITFWEQRAPRSTLAEFLRRGKTTG
jgi:hypothetical protein